MTSKSFKIAVYQDAFPTIVIRDRFKEEFKKLKTNPTYQSKFLGKDSPFTYPPSAKLSNIHHIHILAKNSKGNTSDDWLIYTESLKTPNFFCLLGIIDPPAHLKARRTSILSHYAELAERFHNKN